MTTPQHRTPPATQDNSPLADMAGIQHKAPGRTPTPCSPYYLVPGALEVWVVRNMGEPLLHGKCGTEGREILARMSFKVVDGCQVDYDDVMAKAAVIVRACNSHDALIMVLEAIQDEGKTDYTYEIQQALALAKGE